MSPSRARTMAVLLLTLAACTADKSAAPGKSAAQAAPASESAAQAAPASTAVPERVFGAKSTSEESPIPVASVMADPQPYLGKTLRCEGIVARVCQRAGCWLELSADGHADGLRVPMAGHAFFIPQDAIGQVAVIEGELKAAPLRDEQRAHLEGEGLKAIGPLSLVATSVALRAP
ncbi:MAG: hypothetical protein RL385_5158 [Pseudomonadota bacterium]